MIHNYRPRVLIADDHLLVAEACKSLLEPEFDVIGVVRDGRALVQAAHDLRPDVVIVDIFMPELNGLDAGEQIKKKNRWIKLVYLSMSLSPVVAAAAFRRGASGYVPKQCGTEELIVAVRQAVRGELYLSPLVTRDTVEFFLRSKATCRENEEISDRQREVLELLAEGKRMKEIGYILHIQPSTVAFHKYRIMHNLGVKTTAGLLGYAIRHHMISRQ